MRCSRAHPALGLRSSMRRPAEYVVVRRLLRAGAAGWRATSCDSLKELLAGVCWSARAGASGSNSQCRWRQLALTGSGAHTTPDSTSPDPHCRLFCAPRWARRGARRPARKALASGMPTKAGWWHEAMGGKAGRCASHRPGWRFPPRAGVGDRPRGCGVHLPELPAALLRRASLTDRREAAAPAPGLLNLR